MKTDPLEILQKQHSAAESTEQSAHAFGRPGVAGEAPMRTQLPAPLPSSPPSAEDKAFGAVLVTVAWAVVGGVLLHLGDIAAVVGGGYPIIASAVPALSSAIV